MSIVSPKYHFDKVIDRTGTESLKWVYPRKVLNFLLKHTALRSTFGVIMLALVDNEPRLLSLKRALQYYIEHRQVVVTRRTQFELDKARARDDSNGSIGGPPRTARRRIRSRQR